MEAALDGLDTHAKDLGDFGGGQALHVAQEKHLAVHGFEAADRQLQCMFDLLVSERLVWALRRVRELPVVGPVLTDADFYDEDGLPK